MTNIKKSILIDAPLEEVFDFMADVTNLPEIWPSMVEVKNVVDNEEERSFDWVYKMAGIRFEGHSVTTEFEQNKRVVTKSDKGIPATFTYSYARMGKGTQITMETDYQIPNRVLSKLAEPIVRRINEREAISLLNNLKDRMEFMAASYEGVEHPSIH